VFVKLQLAFLKALALISYTLGKRASERCFDYGHATAAAVQSGPPLPQGSLAIGRPGYSNRVMNTSPKVAIVVPVFMKTSVHVRQVVHLLEALSMQTYTPSLIVLADDCSPRAYRALYDQIVDRYQSFEGNQAKLEIHVAVLPRNRGPAAARQLGIQTVVDKSPDTQVICFTDSDCIPDKNWVSQMMQAQTRAPAIYSGITSAIDNSAVVGLYHDIFGTLNGRCDKSVCLTDTKPIQLLYGPTCNLSVPTCVAMSLGFEETFSAASMEDVDFCLRAQKQGCPVLLLNDARVLHDYVLSISGFCRQFYKYGLWEKMIVSRHPEYAHLLGNSMEIPSTST